MAQILHLTMLRLMNLLLKNSTISMKHWISNGLHRYAKNYWIQRILSIYINFYFTQPNEMKCNLIFENIQDYLGKWYHFFSVNMYSCYHLLYKI